VLKPVSDYTERQSFRLGASLLLSLGIDEDPWKGRHFADPSTIFLAFNFNSHRSAFLHCVKI
jgi:hypothetical protein